MTKDSIRPDDSLTQMLKQARAIGPSAASGRDWTEEEIEAMAAADPDRPTDEQLAQARPAREVMKEIIERYRSKAEGEMDPRPESA